METIVPSSKHPTEWNGAKTIFLLLYFCLARLCIGGRRRGQAYAHTLSFANRLRRHLHKRWLILSAWQKRTTNLALVWQGWDKTFCLQFLGEGTAEYDEIHFFGDKTFVVSEVTAV